MKTQFLRLSVAIFLTIICECNVNAQVSGVCIDQSYCTLLRVLCTRQQFRSFLRIACPNTCGTCPSTSVPVASWSSWTNYGTCSVTCGGGTQQRTRNCIGGTSCVGDSVETSVCSTDICPEECGYIPPATDSWQIIRSPGWPQNYSNSVNCKWTITAPTGWLIRLRFLEFDTENRNDYLEINSSPSNRITGIRDVGLPIDSTTNRLDLRFYSDSRISHRGFQGIFIRITANQAWSSCSRTCGWGSRTRRRCRRCRLDYEDCRIGSCSEENCVPPMVPRYGERNHDCCDASSVILDHCGVNTFGGRIRGGIDSQIQQWPWIVQLTYNGLLGCGGSLISSSHVLTAAHCVTNDLIRYFNLRIHLGANAYQDSADYVEVRSAASIIRHPNYRNSVNSLVNDIAIIELNEPISRNSFVRRICLPGPSIVRDDTTCVVAGWGTVSSGGNPETLQEVSVRILPFGVCENAYPGSLGTRISSTTNVCAGHIAGGVDTCQGDSGGPLMCQPCPSCEWVLVGITSFGSGCARERLPGVYTRVSHYTSWINSVTSTDLVSGGSFASCN